MSGKLKKNQGQGNVREFYNFQFVSNDKKQKMAMAYYLGYRLLDDRYLNLFLNAYINRHSYTEYLKMIEVYSPLGIWYVFLYSINTNIYHFWSMKYRQYA